MPYWRLFYHLVWATKDRAPLINAEIESSLFGIIIDKSEQLRAYIFAVNGSPTTSTSLLPFHPASRCRNMYGSSKG
jgi:putative transposase